MSLDLLEFNPYKTIGQRQLFEITYTRCFRISLLVTISEVIFHIDLAEADATESDQEREKSYHSDLEIASSHLQFDL